MDYIDKWSQGIIRHEDYRAAYHLRCHNIGAGGVYGSSNGGFCITAPMSDKRRTQHANRMYNAIGVRP